MSLLRPLKRNVAVRILPEPKAGSVEAPDLPSSNLVVELIGAGPLADREIRKAQKLLIPRFRPNLAPGSVMILDSDEVLAVVEE